MPNTPDPPQPSSQPAPGTVRRPIPRFPLVVAICAAIAIAVLSQSHFEPGGKNLIGFSILGAASILIVCWFVWFSRVKKFVRYTVGISLATAVAVFLLMFRVEGFSGDMIPTLVRRGTPVIGADLSAPVATTRAADLSTTTENDYPQFLGKNRVPVVDNIRLATDWNTTPPKLLWRQPIGAGWSGFAVVGDYAVTQEQRGDAETGVQLVVCYELRTGEVVWSHADPGFFAATPGGLGPRATPTITGGRVYTMGPLGKLNCLDGATGEAIWSHDTLEENGAENIAWGKAGSPLVTDDLVIVSVGGPDGRSLIAYDRETGDEVWSAGSDQSAYASPVLATLSGVPQVLIVDQDYLVAHRLADGEELWRSPWPGNSNGNASCSQPVVLPGDRVFISKGYRIGSSLLEIRKDDAGQFEAVPLWDPPVRAHMKTKFTNVVIRDGYVYGLDEGILECIELETGERQWKRGRYGHGQIILVGDVILVSTETGEVVLVEASPDAHRELTRFQAIEGKTWNNPALAGRFLLVRNHKEAACYELPLAED